MFNFHEAFKGGGKKENEFNMTNDEQKPVSLEEGKEHFEKFYDQRTEGYRAMAKKRDAEKKKEGKWLLIPGTPESYKYVTENGVLYYDMLGVDAFDDDTFIMRDNEGNKRVYKTKTQPKKFHQDLYTKNWGDRSLNPVSFRWINTYEAKIKNLEEEIADEKDKNVITEKENEIEILKTKIDNLLHGKKNKSSHKAKDIDDDVVLNSRASEDSEDSDDIYEVNDDTDSEDSDEYYELSDVDASDDL